MDDPTTADTGDGDSPIVDMGAYELSCETYHLTGDMDCDCDVDFDDVDPFVLALSGQAAYEAVYPDCNWMNADCNGDGNVDFDDIDPFIALIGD